jgi:hypothetical protein
MDRPDGAPDFIEEDRIPGAAAADGKGHVAPHQHAFPPEVGEQQRQIDRGRRCALQGVVVDVGGNAHDLAPGAGGILANALAERRLRRPPMPAGETLGDEHNGPVLVDIGPCEVPAGHQRCADVRSIRGASLGAPTDSRQPPSPSRGLQRRVEHQVHRPCETPPLRDLLVEPPPPPSRVNA